MTAIDLFVQRLRIRQAARFLMPDDHVLDIGTADGTLFRHLPHISGIGIDPDAVPENFPNAALIAGMFPRDLPDPRQRFDAITMLAVLEHVPEAAQRTLAADCYRFLRPGGRLIITVPSPRVDDILAVLKWFRLIHGMSLEQHYGFDVAKTPALFRSAGFESLKSRKFQFGLNNLFVFAKPAAKTERPLSFRQGA